MDISEFISYVLEKYQLQLQYPWQDFPGFSVFVHPETQKWVACLMRQWDYEQGVEIQRADIKCQASVYSDCPRPFLTQPFRMKGPYWTGVIFEKETQPEVVFGLFDLAMKQEEKRGFTLILEHQPKNTRYVEQPSLFRSQESDEIPEKIMQMLQLYEYENHSFEAKCKNFYRQGKFMEDYEDHVPCIIHAVRYFPTYHDLNIRQLRGYFTWRTEARQGHIDRHSELYAYIYAYELLNDIGIGSYLDGLAKLYALKEAFQETHAQLISHLNRWMFDYMIIHQIPVKEAGEYVPAVLIEEDQRLVILRDPQKYTDDEVFQAFFSFAGRSTQKSILLEAHQAAAVHLFAAVWRYASANCRQDGQDLFTSCFGEKTRFSWHPLGNAVYWAAFPKEDQTYVLNSARTYLYIDGAWYEERYDPLQLKLPKIQGMLREIDRSVRKYLKAGHYLRKKEEEQWIAPYVAFVLEADQKQASAKQRPQVTVNLGQLDQIRQDALITRDQLLTEEEMAELAEPPQAFEPEMENIEGLDEVHTQILWALLKGKKIDELIRANHLLPSVITDTINEVFIEEIGDNILECDGQSITLIEDYKEDILTILGGEKG